MSFVDILDSDLTLFCLKIKGENILAEEEKGSYPVIQNYVVYYHEAMVTQTYTWNRRVSTAYLSGSITQVGLLLQKFSLSIFLLLLHQHINALHYHSWEVWHIPHFPSFWAYGLELFNSCNMMILGCWAQLIGTLNCWETFIWGTQDSFLCSPERPSVMKNSNSKSFPPVCCQAF